MNGKKRLSVESFKRSERDPALQSPTRHALGRLLFILVVWVCVVLLEGTRVFVVQAFAGDAQRAFGRRHQGGETRLPTRARVPDGGGGGLRHAAASEKGAAVQNGNMVASKMKVIETDFMAAIALCEEQRTFESLWKKRNRMV